MWSRDEFLDHFVYEPRNARYETPEEYAYAGMIHILTFGTVDMPLHESYAPEADDRWGFVVDLWSTFAGVRPEGDFGKVCFYLYRTDLEQVVDEFLDNGGRKVLEAADGLPWQDFFA